MRRIWAKCWAVLRFTGRWLGPLLIVLAAGLFLFPPIPFGDPSPSMALAGGIISAIAWLFARGPERRTSRRFLATCALAALAFFGWHKWEERRGYREEIVTLDNRGAHLVGTLYLPDRAGKVPGIVWVHGSGPQTRTINAPLAVHLARSGYAVLMFDKRGAGESTGHLELERAISPDNIDLLASDASTALTLLAKRPEVRVDAIGFVGASQAGWITPRAAVLNGHAAFMLLLSGPTTSTHTFLRYERFHIRPGGNPLMEVIKAFGQGDIPDGLTPDQADALAQQTAIDLPYPDYDPAADLRRLDIPGLWLLGDSDWMVPSGSTTRAIDELRKAGKPYEYRHIPGAWHAMAVGPKRLVLDTIDNWLAQVTATKPPIS